MKTVFDVFSKAVEAYGDRPFVHIPLSAAKSYSDSAIDYTYAEASREVEQRRAAYGAAGYGVGHRVAILLENRADFFFHWLALNALGVGIIPLNAEASPQDLHYIIYHGDADLVVSLPEKMTLVEEAIALEQESEHPPLCSATLEGLPPATRPALDHIPDTATECAMLFTSGSTGQPKGCVLSNEYFIAFGDWYRNVGGYCELHPGRGPAVDPLAAGAYECVGLLHHGHDGRRRLYHPARPLPSQKLVGQLCATVAPPSSITWAYCRRSCSIWSRATRTRPDKVRFGFGAGVNPKHHAAFEERFGFPLIEAWAMTESGCGGCVIASHEPRHVGECCFGRATDEVEYRLVDDEGNDVDPGLPGELLVRATGEDPRYGFFDHYYQNSEATEEAWEDNWLHTGDIVREGADKSLYFVDRKKNVVRRSGENISALEVENVLLLDPAVDTVAVAPVHGRTARRRK